MIASTRGSVLALAEDRRYDEREVGLILRRVAELHESEGENADARAMTRSEIEQVVQDLGISKALVARATSELAAHDSSAPVWRLGGKTKVMFEDVVAGELDDAALTPMLEVLRRTLGEPGELKHEGGATIWSTTANGMQRVHFTVVPHAGRTTLRLEEDMSGEANVIVGLTAFFGGFLGFMMIVPLKALVVKALLLLMMGPLALSGALVGWLGGRAIWKRRSRTREQKLRRAFAAIMALTEERKALPAARDDDDADATR
ncbi:MAG TPA: hypothetical protein VG755_10370 [Nannocystaceae bacterium]|nr:hypothetical protein [Nannocystaceae bacterium]